MTWPFSEAEETARSLKAAEIRVIRAIYSRNCLTVDEFRHGLSQIVAFLIHREYRFMETALDVKNEIETVKAKVDILAGVITDLRNKLSALAVSGGATEADLLSMVADLKAVEVAEDAAAGTAVAPPAPAPKPPAAPATPA